MKKGFTLIELLVVIAIIGILAVALLPTILGAPAKGRDAARKANLTAISTALEAANLDKGQYPSPGAKLCLKTAMFSAAPFNATPWNADPKIQTYFQGGQVPVDPIGTSAGPTIGGCGKGEYLYCQTGLSGSNYYLAATMEIYSNANAVASDVGTPGCYAAGTAVAAPTLTTPSASNGPWAFVMIK
jgi:type II secretion system protein G